MSLNFYLRSLRLLRGRGVLVLGWKRLLTDVLLLRIPATIFNLFFPPEVPQAMLHALPGDKVVTHPELSS